MKSAFTENFKLLQPWSDEFNSQAYDRRRIGAAMEIGTRLQHLHFERQRLQAAYRKSLADIASHEKNLVRSLREFGSPTDLDTSAGRGEG